MPAGDAIDVGTSVLVAFLGGQALLKFGFFALPYRRRRAALDAAYGAAPTATRRSDAVLLALTGGVTALLFARATDPVGILGGFWIGATLIQLYFHRFHAQLAPDHAPPPAGSPIKTMSYAIQASPWRPWREIATMAAIIVAALVLIARQHSGT